MARYGVYGMCYVTGEEEEEAKADKAAAGGANQSVARQEPWHRPHNHTSRHISIPH